MSNAIDALIDWFSKGLNMISLTDPERYHREMGIRPIYASAAEYYRWKKLPKEVELRIQTDRARFINAVNLIVAEWDGADFHWIHEDDPKHPCGELAMQVLTPVVIDKPKPCAIPVGQFENWRLYLGYLYVPRDGEVEDKGVHCGVGISLTELCANPVVLRVSIWIREPFIMCLFVELIRKITQWYPEATDSAEQYACLVRDYLRIGQASTAETLMEDLEPEPQQPRETAPAEILRETAPTEKNTHPLVTKYKEDLKSGKLRLYVRPDNWNDEEAPMNFNTWCNSVRMTRSTMYRLLSDAGLQPETKVKQK